MARGVLPRKVAAPARVGVRLAQGQFHRDQRELLLAATARKLCGVVRGHAGRLCVRGQREPLHHPHEKAEGRRRRRSRISLPPACCGSAQSSAHFSGSCRRISATTASDWRRSSACCRATPSAAAKLARGHDERLAGRAWTETDATRPLRHCLEVRHPTFVNAELIALLREHDIALVVADTAGKWPFLEDATSDFVYVRLHGDEELYASGYSEAALRSWAQKVRAWAKGGLPPNAQLAGPRLPRRAGRTRCLCLLRQ